ncbi:hypothetical protein M3Y97_00910900 [Aphelenchoides bicaudatus]|nr:hypothetical protein M3Y97_00910900 [Aphelenchoides bicaudatus]
MVSKQPTLVATLLANTLLEAGSYRIAVDQFCSFYDVEAPDFKNCTQSSFSQEDLKQADVQQGVSYPVVLSSNGLRVIKVFVCSLKSRSIYYQNFLTEDEINSSSEYLKQRFPAIEQLYSLRVEEMKTKTDWKNEMLRMNWFYGAVKRTATDIIRTLSDVIKQLGESRVGLSRCRNTWNDTFHITLG